MENKPASPPKPVSEIWRPDLIVLPQLTPQRKAYRRLYHATMKLLTLLLLRATINGAENFPKKGPALLIINHSGDADIPLATGAMPYPTEWVGKIEHRDDHWLTGPVWRMYGGIWIHRGKPDRSALRVILEGLAEGRMITLAPEGRQTLTGGLEEGTDGAAFLALKSGAPVVPIAMAGTENSNVYGSLKKWRRAQVTLTVGKPFHIREQADRRDSIRAGTRQIMESLARLLPSERRGLYNYVSERTEPE